MATFLTRHPALKDALLTPFNLLYKVNNKWGIAAVFAAKTHKLPHIQQPRTFNEKLQWLKLYYRDDLYPVCADKLAVREYVRQAGCGELLGKLYWSGTDAGDIPFDELPTRFVAKATHGCGYNLICTDKRTLNRGEAVEKLNRWRQKTYLACYGEWFYGVEPPSIICEEYIEGDAPGAAPKDYKVHCFGGRPKLVQLDAERFTKRHFRNFYDLDWNLLDYSVSIPNNMGHQEERPPLLADMLAAARQLAKPFPYARIDFYISQNRLVFGEITLTHGGGFVITKPEELNRMMGDWITLPAPKNPVGGKAP